MLWASLFALPAFYAVGSAVACSHKFFVIGRSLLKQTCVRAFVHYRENAGDIDFFGHPFMQYLQVVARNFDS